MQYIQTDAVPRHYENIFQIILRADLAFISVYFTRKYTHGFRT